MTLRKWGDEVSFKIKYQHNIAEKDQSIKLEDDKIKWVNHKTEVHFYDIQNQEHPKGAYEFDITLNEKPSTNKVEMSIETKGLKFYYQPPLTEEFQNGYSEEFQKEIVVIETDVKDLEGNVLVHRPENVVGSYAVYHESKQGDYSQMGGKNYRAGKAFHIYRPKIFDSAGTEVWGELKITDSILTVEIPQEFLDKAVYPVRHAAGLEFGYHTNGQSSVSSTGGRACANVATPAGGDGDVSKISIYLDTTYNLYIKGVLWLQSTGAVITNGVTDENTNAGSGLTWYDLTYSTQPEVTNGVNYYVGYVPLYSGRTLHYDTGDSGDGGRDWNSYTPPASFDSPTNTTYKFSAYATYSAANSAPVASAATIDSGVSSITLTEGTTKNVVCEATVTDGDGFGDIDSVEAKLYRTSQTASGADDNNHRYTRTGNGECVPSGGSGNTETYTCTFAVQYYADPTDATSIYSTDDWTCQVTPTDGGGAGTADTDTIEMNSLQSLNVTNIDFSSVAAGSSSIGDTHIATVTNTGNVAIDFTLLGGALTCGGRGSVPVGNQEYSLATFVYSNGTDLTAGAVQINAVLGVPESDTVPITDITYWQVGVPVGTEGTCTGTTTFAVTAAQ